MRLSLVSLVTDLELRAVRAQELLSAAPDLGGRRDSASQALGHIRAEAAQMLAQDLTGDPDRFYPIYSRLTRELFERESLELPFLIHHGADAERATRLCGKLLADIGWPYPEPILVSTFSTDYYWTHPQWRVIAIPCGKERCLLGTPDLCHELAHSVYGRDDRKLVGDFALVLAAELRSLVDPKAPDGTPGSRSHQTEVFLSWTDAWLQEFACDLLATYVVGPAFPRQHARLRAMVQPPVPHCELRLNTSHPADHARMLICLRLLGEIGSETEARRLDEIWREMLDAAEEECPVHFDLYYPPACLAALVERVIAGCEALGLRAYDPEADPSEDLPSLTNDAWRRFAEEPTGYRGWEKEKLSELWAAWGL